MSLTVRAADARALGAVTVSLRGDGPPAQALSEVISQTSNPVGKSGAIWVVQSGPQRATQTDFRTWRLRAGGRRARLSFRVIPTRPGLYAMRYVIRIDRGLVAPGALHAQIQGAPLLHF